MNLKFQSYEYHLKLNTFHDLNIYKVQFLRYAALLFYIISCSIKWRCWKMIFHYNDVIMGVIACQITSLTIVYSTVYSDADGRKHQSSASLAFVWGIHRWPVNSPHKWPVTRKLFPFDGVIMVCKPMNMHEHDIFISKRKARNSAGCSCKLFISLHSEQLRTTWICWNCYLILSYFFQHLIILVIQQMETWLHIYVIGVAVIVIVALLISCGILELMRCHRFIANQD